MTDSAEKTPVEVPSAAACAEAAAWIARLHGEGRTLVVEAGFKRWLAASPEHRAAFELANEIWIGVESLPKPRTPALVRWPRVGFVVTLPRALVAAAALLVLLAVGMVWYSRESGLSTRVGEQRSLALEDGTRVYLNTASRIHVHYDRVARRVELDQGEAYFEVVKHPDWPFIVIAGTRQIVARGTAFLVRREETKLAVTLVEGKVTVSPAGETVTPLPLTFAPHASDIALTPGQRLTFLDRKPPQLDRPALERVTAWQRGQVILDHTPLAEAVAEMNRYSRVELKIAQPEVGRAQVTGIFRLGDSGAFAAAVAEMYHLQVTDRAGEIVLLGRPRASAGAVASE